MDADGYSIHDLARLGGVATHTIRDWIGRGLLPHAQLAGPKTRYTEGHLLRIRAIRKLKSETLSLDAIKERLAGMNPQDLERFINPPTTPPSVPEPPFPPSERWRRLVLCPGLELHVADTVMHRRMAQQVYEDFLARQRQ